MFNTLIEQRRSIRKFKDRPIEKEKIDHLIEAALRSPSSRSLNPWRFIVVDRPDLLEKLATAKPHGSSFLKKAPLGIVVCANPLISDVWVEDTSIASIFIHLAAASLGLGSCWIQIRKREHDSSKSADTYIKDLLGIPDNIMIESIIAIGYPDEVKKRHPKKTLEYDKVSFNIFCEKD
ncbi:MAG: NAD(P)H-dependent dehydrogenase/reductase [Desulfobacteraceae bacterium]|nr:NAD(P)H-dependent dehydrogenase/reductase [Desulfobacteraceae bacterium]